MIDTNGNVQRIDRRSERSVAAADELPVLSVNRHSEFDTLAIVGKQVPVIMQR
jgi:hypothetical protein